MEGAPRAPLALRLLFFAALPATGWLTTVTLEPPLLPPAPKDSLRINVTTLEDGEMSKEQVVLNLTYESGQVYVNDFPVNSGVTRISCQTLIVKNENLENLEEKEYFGIVSVRILVHEWPMTSGSSLQLIVIQEEVVEIDGKQAQQKDITEIDILVKNQGIVRRSNYTLPLEESMLYSISRDSDILFTLPNLSKKGEGVSSLQTTSQYLIRNVETTVNEALPGKLPETPLRAEPPSSYKSKEEQTLQSLPSKHAQVSSITVEVRSELPITNGHYRLDGHEFEQAPRVADGQGSLAYCSPWGRKESDMTEQLN
uniref:Glycoprotein integral membrane protein 1 n=1 Tax=Capra hircus TaxID=9925 RepID=A0A8C2RRK5_CAPHI